MQNDVTGEVILLYLGCVSFVIGVQDQILLVDVFVHDVVGIVLFDGDALSVDSIEVRVIQLNDEVFQLAGVLVQMNLAHFVLAKLLRKGFVL